MGTTIRPELSDKNKYWIDKHRFYELKHFCLQYNTWKKAYVAIDGMSKRSNDIFTFSKSNIPGDPTARCAESKAYYFDRMKMVEQTAIATDPSLATYILKAVTEGHSYEYLKSRLDIPCCKDTYYELFRRFFWLLSRARN